MVGAGDIDWMHAARAARQLSDNADEVRMQHTKSLRIHKERVLSAIGTASTMGLPTIRARYRLIQPQKSPANAARKCIVQIGHQLHRTCESGIWPLVSAR
jgi:hypothetical protein